MSEQSGHIELARTLDSIVIGFRHRHDLGDIDALMRSIDEHGLLQPITITPDGVLVCGRRRLEAVKRLGWRTLKVWVRSGLSDELSRILAQQDENEQHKPLTPLEEAALFEELSRVLTEDATRRQEESRFGGACASGEVNGGEDSSPPGPAGEVTSGEDSSPPVRRKGKTREQASKILTGKLSFQRLEQTNAVKRASEDPDLPLLVRELAATELKKIENGADVSPAFHRVKAAVELAGTDFPAGSSPTAEDLEQLLEEADERAQQDRARGGGRPRAKQKSTTTSRSLRAFLLTWSDLDGWSRHYEASEVAAQVKDSDWEMFERVLAETTDFAASVRELRQMPASA
ncbi:MAG: ParB N-terminal domain-containing protein [Nocardioides sp.]|uniref:ParB N-terminal domain-containing protein n=1 Tax=Nocardioides sp. TaxID=35761 RepID=UPI0039E44A1F